MCQKTVLGMWGRSILYSMSYSRVACDVIIHSQWRHGLSTVSGGWLPVYESVARTHTIYLRIHEISPTHKPQNSWSARFFLANLSSVTQFYSSENITIPSKYNITWYVFGNKGVFHKIMYFSRLNRRLLQISNEELVFVFN